MRVHPWNIAEKERNIPGLNPKTCHRCGKRLTHETWVRSRPTNKYYCRELDACAKRAKKNAKEEHG